MLLISFFAKAACPTHYTLHCSSHIVYVDASGFYIWACWAAQFANFLLPKWSI